MSIAKLKTAIKQYCKRQGATDPEYTVDGVDLLLLALNNARKEAEQLLDFELAKACVDITVNTYSGGSMATAKETGTEALVKVKSIHNGGVVNSAGIVVPCDIMPYTNFLTVQEKNRDHGDFYTEHKVLVQGNRLFFSRGTTEAPGENKTVRLVVQRWMPDYEEDEDTDFFVEHCYNYLLWQGIIEINHLTFNFVPRQEGNLPPPEASRDRAFAAMERWNDFMYEGGRTIEL